MYAVIEPNRQQVNSKLRVNFNYKGKRDKEMKDRTTDLIDFLADLSVEHQKGKY